MLGIPDPTMYQLLDKPLAVGMVLALAIAIAIDYYVRKREKP